MGLKLTQISFANVDELYKYKKLDFRLPPFPGYTNDQWGIKAHNRPWIEEAGMFDKGQNILEVGGAYSTLPQYLAEKYNLKAWIGDDFGSDMKSNWSRWGNPKELVEKNKNVKYIFKNFGCFHPEFPDKYFDRIFSVSTLEHIPFRNRLNVFRDMNRCTKSGGMQLHTIDIPAHDYREIIKQALVKKYPIFKLLYKDIKSEIDKWLDIIKMSGIKITTKPPNPIQLLDRKILVESPDVVYRFYPPNEEPKKYKPAASLLLTIQDE